MEYGTFKLAKTEQSFDLSGFLYRVGLYFRSLGAELTYVVPPLFVIGLIVSLREALGRVLAVLFACYVVVFNYLANLPLDTAQFRGVFARFWMQPNILVLIWAGVGFAEIHRRIPLHWKRRLKIALIGLALSPAAYHIITNWQTMDQSGNLVVLKLGQSVLKSLPPRAILLTKGDIFVNALRYVQQCEHFREDVSILDQELMSLDWFQRARPYLPNVRFPGTHYHPIERGAFTMKALLDANADMPIFLLGSWKEDIDTRHVKEYMLFQFGFAERLYRTDPDFATVTHWAKEATDALGKPSDMSLPLDRKHWGPETWEVVIDNDYFESMHRIGYHVLMWAITHNNHRDALRLSADLLQQSLDTHPRKPFHIYKNLGIANGRLFESYGIAESQERMVLAFERYLQKTQNETSEVGARAQIQQVVDDTHRRMAVSSASRKNRKYE
mmetsp:Transcript_47218/g.78654  ORF Transcript_47218/g.78654 Transcript_47218/m.78654 type:complete len:442 (-) Transcript_47218:83-1408(-)